MARVHQFSVKALRLELLRYAAAKGEAEYEASSLRPLVAQAMHGADKPASAYLNGNGSGIPPKASVPLVPLVPLYALFARTLVRGQVKLQAAELRNLLRQAIAAVARTPEDLTALDPARAEEAPIVVLVAAAAQRYARVVPATSR